MPAFAAGLGVALVLAAASYAALEAGALMVAERYDDRSVRVEATHDPRD